MLSSRTGHGKGCRNSTVCARRVNPKYSSVSTVCPSLGRMLPTGYIFPGVREGRKRIWIEIEEVKRSSRKRQPVPRAKIPVIFVFSGGDRVIELPNFGEPTR